MGRPLKIQQYDAAAAVPLDQGYPNQGSLTAPVGPTVAGLSATQFLGVVGGNSSTATTTTFPRILVQVNITLASGSAAGSAAGYIIRQKGAHKYLVGDVTSRTAVVASNAYRITTVGDTDWTSTGVANAAFIAA